MIMHIKKNITLIKGFEMRENGHLFCKDYDFGRIDEIAGKTFTLDRKDDDLKLCERGFHACDCLGKTSLFYEIDKENCVFFSIFVENAFFENAEKFVFKSFTVKERIDTQKLISEDYNAGDCNVGYRNIGDHNTGKHNTGDRNTGRRNTGRRNTGDCNTGHFNTGDFNTGDCNTGDYNTGDYNTGHCNTGDCNTGNYNTGDRNTGSRNLTNHSSGFFAFEEPLAFCFGKPTDYTHAKFTEVFKDIIIHEPCFDSLMRLPNASKETVEMYLTKLEAFKKNSQNENA
jgi:hypothetical protein